MFIFSVSTCYLKELKKNLNRNIKGLDDFKLAMRIIATIQSTNISSELQLHEIQETFAILADHKIEVMNFLVANEKKKKRQNSWRKTFFSKNKKKNEKKNIF